MTASTPVPSTPVPSTGPAPKLADQAVAMTVALPALTAGLALKLAPVRVNLIAAGFVDTPLSAQLLGDDLDRRRGQQFVRV